MAKVACAGMLLVPGAGTCGGTWDSAEYLDMFLEPYSTSFQ